jgi:protein-disulfide isomerase
VDALRAERIDPARIERMVATKTPGKKVDDDMALGQKIGVTGTPTTFVNGVKVSGAQPLERLREVVDQQLAEAKALRAGGVPASLVYAQLSKRNFAGPPKAAGAAAPAPSPKPARPAAAPAGSQTVWRVPVAGSPAKGPRNAWVTLVVFAEFQCPFSARLAPVLDQLRQKYGQRLRIVFKHNPLPFHKRAEPAAQLSLEAFARKGHAGFWAAHDKLFAQQRQLEDADLEQLAAALGLSPQRTMRAVRQHKHRRRIEDDQDLADELEARGTPTCFINGRKLTGARPLADLEQLIDEEIARARTLVAQGVPSHRIYAHIQKSAQASPPPPKKTVPRPTAAQPSKGPRHAPVTIQIFSDFECPYCARVKPTLDRIEQEFGGKVRLVWRHLPLKFHANSRPAAIAATEAFRQRGNAGFWQMHDLLFANRERLDRASLVSYAAQAGLDVRSFERALETDRHGSIIDRDVGIAKAAGIRGTPAFVINGYFVSGAQPFTTFKRLIKRALREAGRRP